MNTNYNTNSKYGLPKGARVLVVTDTHLRDVDFKPIGGYVKATNQVWMDIIEFCQQNNVTHLMHTGDLCDKGYRAIGRSQNDSNLIRKASDVVNGEFYMAIGNHFYIERDNNPVMYLIQPHQDFIPSNPIFSEKPVIKVVDQVMVEGVQFSFFHFNKNDKSYVRRRHPDAVKHIGIYHDDCMVPSSVRSKLGMRSNISSEYFRMIFSNIDKAVVGHIHIPIGIVYIQLDGRQLDMNIPGSLAVCKSSELHTEVNLPMYDIHDGQITERSVTFSLHADKLKFFEKKESSLPQNMIQNKESSSPIEMLQSNIGEFLGLEEFLREEGFRNSELEIIRKAASYSLDLKEAVRVYLNRDKLNQII